MADASALRLTQHKRFVPDDNYSNYCFAKNSFMLGMLDETVDVIKRKRGNNE